MKTNDLAFAINLLMLAEDRIDGFGAITHNFNQLMFDYRPSREGMTEIRNILFNKLENETKKNI